MDDLEKNTVEAPVREEGYTAIFRGEDTPFSDGLEKYKDPVRGAYGIRQTAR